MKRLVLLALPALLVTFALMPASVGAQSTCSCPWQVVQGDNSGSTDCATAQRFNENNLKSYAYWSCGHTPCTTVYTHLSCSIDGSGTATETGLLNYKCC